jgi:hypothetical protein
VLEHPFLFFGHAQHELAGDSTASDDAGQSERHRPDPVLLGGQHGNHEDPFSSRTTARTIRATVAATP